MKDGDRVGIVMRKAQNSDIDRDLTKLMDEL
jgi:hypothetical protein